MTEINSDELKIDRNPEAVYAFLNDLRNYENLMPTNDVSDFTATVDKAELSLKGLGQFSISVTESTPNSLIRLKPKGKLPFSFDIEWHISGAGDSTTVVGKINAELNMFMKMMAEPKLRNFVDQQAHKLKAYLEREVV
ncbi:MAG: carbon monoxide dehydrogenase subunit G [Bacteroidia bacterium]|jgi:carbon monoxide dehydrogenase subunit G